ncbi:MAG: AmmeMemoRadiSam system protein B [Candidatus Stahlbacteria bacterium]|nr:MAG: AmmeMemoRadiSam system protein B [Candidatus Stahlbacteria bacterium]
MTVRRPTWGNQFYPTDPDEARGMWEGFFKRCESSRIEDTIRAIQVPHAGWVYSGQAAAEAYNQLRDRELNTVVMIGPQHHVPVRHMQVFPEGIWESPIGNLEVDARLASEFLEFDEAFQADIPAHAAEHSLEVQIPPLAMASPETKIVPILTAPYQPKHPRILADALGEIVGTQSDVLVLISTDLYHGESYEACKTTDSRTIELVQAMDAKGLESALANGSAAACGGDGLTALLYAAQKLGIKKAHLLAACNSNDITGQRGGYVVGYSAFAFV